MTHRPTTPPAPPPRLRASALNSPPGPRQPPMTRPIHPSSFILHPSSPGLARLEAQQDDADRAAVREAMSILGSRRTPAKAAAAAANGAKGGRPRQDPQPRKRKAS